MTAASSRVASLLVTTAWVILQAACSGPSTPRRSELPRTEVALPVGDPAQQGTPIDRRPTPAIQQVAVRVARTPDGGVQLLEILSPALSDAERAELMDAMAKGQARPSTPPPPGTTIWITTVPFPTGR